jgi:hypothetical protein
MEVNFKYVESATPEPVRIEQVFAEKPGGGVVANPESDLPTTTPVKYDADKECFVAIDSTDSTTVPDYITGAPVFAGKGDQLVRLINGANLRKETAVITAAQAALIPTIKLV